MKKDNRIRIHLRRKYFRNPDFQNMYECPLSLAMLDAGFDEPQVLYNNVLVGPEFRSLVRYNIEECIMDGEVIANHFGPTPFEMVNEAMQKAIRAKSKAPEVYIVLEKSI